MNDDRNTWSAEQALDDELVCAFLGGLEYYSSPYEALQALLKHTAEEAVYFYKRNQS